MIVGCHRTGAGNSKAAVSEDLDPRQALFDDGAPDYRTSLRRRVSSPIEDADDQACAGTGSAPHEVGDLQTTPAADADGYGNEIANLQVPRGPRLSGERPCGCHSESVNSIAFPVYRLLQGRTHGCFESVLDGAVGGRATNRMKVLIRADRPIKAAANAHLLVRTSTIATMPTRESTPTIHHCKRHSVGLSARSLFARNW